QCGSGATFSLRGSGCAPSEVNQMKHTAVALTLATFLLAGTPVLAKPTPSAPPTYLPSVVMPYDAYAPLFLAPIARTQEAHWCLESRYAGPDSEHTWSGGEELIFQTRSP